MISPLLASLPRSATPEEVLRHPPHEAWTLARVLDALLMKMGRMACWLRHAVGRRQASLGTPVPRMPINKQDAHGIIIRKKARLASQGYSQVECNDYCETFAPVAALNLFIC